MRIIIADNQPEIRSALRFLIEHETEGSVVEELNETDDLIAIARRFRPDIVLLDWQLRQSQMVFGGVAGLSVDGQIEAADEAAIADGSAARLLQALRGLNPQLKIIALSSRPESHSEAVAAGVDAFISKTESPDGLLEVLRSLREHNIGQGQAFNLQEEN